MTRIVHGRRLLAGACLALTVSGAPARAQSAIQTLPSPPQFGSITDFGDSYADTGTAPGGGFRMLGWPGCPAGPSAGYPTCRFTGGTNFVDSLQATYGLPAATNYAVGGARTDTTNTFGVAGAGFAQELVTFAASGKRFAANDLIVLSVGGNDTSLVPSTSSTAQVTSLATTSAANAAAGVLQLVASGAHTIAWLSPGNSTYLAVPPAGKDGLPLTTAQRTAWAQTYYQQVQELVASAARAGVRIFLFDLETLQARLHTNPGQYGFASADNCQASLGASGCFYWNGVHPTGAGMALIAGYMANQMDAPLTVVSQGSVTTTIAAAFVGSLLGRLDAYRTSPASGTSPGARAPSAGNWSVYGEVGYVSGREARQSFAADDDHHAVGGTVGIEYRVGPRLRLGSLFAYSAPEVALGVQGGHDRVHASQVGGYGSFTGVNWFADALVAYGRHDHALDRRGVIDVVQGNTAASTVTVAGEAGYLVRFGSVHAGPIAGLDNTRAAIEAYTETGDSLLTMAVDRQAFDSVTGNAGLQVRIPFPLGRGLYSPFINITARHDFAGPGRIVTTTQVSAPLLPVLTPVPEDGGTYGQVAAGVAARMTRTVSAAVHAATSVARTGHRDAVVSGGFTISF